MHLYSIYFQPLGYDEQIVKQIPFSRPQPETMHLSLGLNKYGDQGTQAGMEGSTQLVCFGRFFISIKAMSFW